MGLTIAGPAWTVRGDTPSDTGRQPLAVETVTGVHAGALVPGVITTTPHARYLALHARLAVEAKRRNWTAAKDLGRFRELSRRAEVILGAISVAHADQEPDNHAARAGRIGPHGINAIRRAGDVSSESIDVEALAATYSRVPGGYRQTYGGVEALIGLTDDGVVPEPGPAADESLLAALDEIIVLAATPRLLTPSDLAGLRHLCLCAVADAPDGRCVRNAYFTDRGESDRLPITHRLSARLLQEALTGSRVGVSPDMRMDTLCCFTPKLGDRLGQAALYEHAMAWRGALLRNWSVWAWRIIWARLVAPLSTPGTREEAIAAFVRDLPDRTVRQVLIDGLPELVNPTGDLLPAEHEILEHPRNAEYWTVEDLFRLVAVGARRQMQLDPIALQALVGQQHDDLGPAWVQAWIERDAERPLAEAISDVAHMLFVRAEAVSRQKMQWTTTGLRLPSRLRHVGDRLRLEGVEGSSQVSLRLNTFASVMQQLGILAVHDGIWQAGAYAGEAAP